MRSKVKYILLLSLNMCCFIARAQKEGNVWCFPDQAGMDFNNTASPDTFTSAIGQTGFGYPLDNQTSIADSNGNLFCYAAATEWNFHSLYVWDRTHQVMAHGNNLQGHANFSSLLLPYPGIDSMICLLHFNVDSTNSNYYRLFYSTINKNLNNGYGDVVLRDSLIYYGTLTDKKLAACKHANGRDWWVVVYNYGTGNYTKFLLTPAGISLHSTQAIGSLNICLYYGKLIFSTDGTKMMTVGDYQGCVDVFDFDRCTGLISNFRDIGEHLASSTALQYTYYNCEFSPNGNVIYVTPDYPIKVFNQWNLNAGDINAIRASKTLLNQYPDSGMFQSTTYYSHKLAPNGKIYVPLSSNYQGWYNTVYTHHLDVIENPDVPGNGCNYVQQAFDLGSHFVAGDMPNIPYYGLGPVVGSVCDSLIHIGINEIVNEENSIELFPNPSAGIFSLRLKDVNDKIILVNVEDVLGSFIPNPSPLEKGVVTSIDISNNPPGIYFVHVTTQKKKMFVSKIMKE